MKDSRRFKCENHRTILEESRNMGVIGLLRINIKTKLELFKWRFSKELCGGTHVENTGI